ncbi:MAG TPA: hypothetical protein VIV60_12315 [Polyangiaceae bacterium]
MFRAPRQLAGFVTWAILAHACGGRMESDQAPTSRGGTEGEGADVASGGASNSTNKPIPIPRLYYAGGSSSVTTSSAAFGGTQDPPGWIDCGDGIVDEDEDCDDGNRHDGDGCSSRCVLE